MTLALWNAALLGVAAGAFRVNGRLLAEKRRALCCAEGYVLIGLGGFDLLFLTGQIRADYRRLLLLRRAGKVLLGLLSVSLVLTLLAWRSS